MDLKWISEIFKNTRGIRQGYPLSALLFVISVETMALRLRENKNINGIKVKLIFHFFNFLFPVKFLKFFLVMSKEYT
jgi:hypothetical protein